MPIELARAAKLASPDDVGSASLGDLVTVAVREEILSGELKPGERLIERSIAKRLEVSRSPVREALHRLEQEGFARSLPSGGTYVSLMTVDALREIFEVRSALEWRVGQLVAAAIGDDDLEELRALTVRMAESAEAGNVDGEVAADLEFHASLARLSGNKRLSAMLTSLHSQILQVVRLSVEETPAPERIRNHEELVAVLERRDCDLAAAALESHVVDAGHKAVNALRRQIADAIQDPRDLPVAAFR